MTTTADYRGMHRKALMALAGEKLCDTMVKFTTDHDGLTALEWLEVFANASRRIREDALRDEWREAVAVASDGLGTRGGRKA